MKETTIERILRVSAELFAAQGYAATGVSEIAEAASLGKGALYYHIGSKEELLYEISKRHVEQALHQGEALIDADLPAEAKLRRLSRHQMRAIGEHLPEVTVYFRDGHHLSGEYNDRLQTIRNRWEAVWRAVLEQGVAEGTFRSADSIAVKGLLGIFNYSWVWLRPTGELSSDEVADRLADIALHGAMVADPPRAASTHHTRSDRGVMLSP